MAGLLTVVNPRHRRRHKNRRRRARARAHAPRRRRRARAINPVHHFRRRRRVNARRRRHNPRRRRHHNPLGMGRVTNVLMKGAAIGGGALASDFATKAINHFVIKGGDKGTGTPLSGLPLVALKAGVGLIVLPMVLKFIPGGSKFANSVRLGAAISVVLDLYDQNIKASIVKNAPWLGDYQYGSLNGVGGWAPQSGMSDYQYGALNGAADAYGGGTYD